MVIAVFQQWKLCNFTTVLKSIYTFVTFCRRYKKTKTGMCNLHKPVYLFILQLSSVKAWQFSFRRVSAEAFRRLIHNLR